MSEPRDGAGGEETRRGADRGGNDHAPARGSATPVKQRRQRCPAAGADQHSSAITRSTCHAASQSPAGESRSRKRAWPPHNAARWDARMPPSSVSRSALHGCREKCRRSTDASSRTARRTRSKSGDQGRDDESGEELLEREPQRTVQRHSPAAAPSDPEPGSRGCQQLRPTQPLSHQTAATRRAFRIDRAARAASQDRSPPPQRGATGPPGGSLSDTSWRPVRQRGVSSDGPIEEQKGDRDNDQHDRSDASTPCRTRVRRSAPRRGEASTSGSPPGARSTMVSGRG